MAIARPLSSGTLRHRKPFSTEARSSKVRLDEQRALLRYSRVLIEVNFLVRKLNAALPSWHLVFRPAGFETGGIAWFQDLAVADPTWALPVISGACLLLIPEFAFRPAPETVVRENIKLLKDPERSKDISFGTKFTMLLQAPEVVDRLKIGMQVMTPLMFPIVSNLPAGVTLYWATSSSLSLLQTLCLNSDRFRKMIGISSFANSYKEKREETKASKFLREYTQAAKDVQKAKVLVEKRFGSSASSRHLKQIQQLIDAAQKRGVIENRLMAQMAVHQETGELFMTFTPNFKPNLPDKA